MNHGKSIDDRNQTREKTHSCSEGVVEVNLGDQRLVSELEKEIKRKSPTGSQHDLIQCISSDSENEELPRNDDKRVKGQDRMKEVPELNILLPYKKRKNPPQVFERMVDRLRSSQTTKKNYEHGTNDEQENSASSDHHDKENGIDENNHQEENDREDDDQNDSSSYENREENWKEMQDMPVEAIDKTTVDKIHVDSLWDQMDLLSPSPCHEQVEQENSEIPTNFSLEDYDAKPLEEKSYWDIEGDKLFEEMDFSIAAEGIRSTHSNNIVNQTPIEKEVVIGGTLRNCGPDKHLLVLDEQIGIRCKRCSYVEVEIRYISPTFNTIPWKKTKRKEFREDRNNIDIHQPFQMNFENGGSHLNEDIIDTAETVWGLIPGMRKTMYSHQRNGFEFIWNNIEGSIFLEDLKNESSNGGNGCIISHAPGTGKTRLTIMFIKSYLELYPTRKVFIIAPSNMLLTWEEEFRKWKVNIPFHNMNGKDFSGQEVNTVVNLVNQFRDKDKHSNRLVKLFSWKKDKSVLGMSYGLFEKLEGGNGIKKSCKNQIDSLQVTQMLRELPDLLVLDEGHTARNENSLIWKALLRIQTKKRIILSGTPFQNNFHELFNTLCMVRPNFVDKFVAKKAHGISKEHTRDKKENIALNRWISLTNGVAENDDERIKELKDIIFGMAHVYKGGILKESLPGLRDSLVVLKPMDLQNTILNDILKMKNGLEREHCISLTSVHPSLLIHSQLSKKEEFLVYMSRLDALKKNPEGGVKTKFLVELIRLSEALDEKVLIFSQYIPPLTLIMDQLKSYFGWSEGKEMLYMDGAKNTKLRQKSIRSFNNSDSAVKVMLASTKACSEGISLVGASRVVLLDVVWNPSVERQAISRAYRIGQKKIVYTYHLVACEAESTKYGCQTRKDHLSKIVFSSTDDTSNADISERSLMGTIKEDKILEELVQNEKTCHMFERIIHQDKEGAC